MGYQDKSLFIRNTVTSVCLRDFSTNVLQGLRTILVTQ